MRRGLTGGWIQASVTVDPALKGISALIIWSTKPLKDAAGDIVQKTPSIRIPKKRDMVVKSMIINLKRRTTRMPPMINETPNSADRPGE